MTSTFYLQIFSENLSILGILIQFIGKKAEIPIEIDDHFKLFGKEPGK